ncbi:MAG: hypothetical protein JW780_04755 [Clostridiales bacterium]|nr:hypothetical protein [Clostridiales bacterium]
MQHKNDFIVPALPSVRKTRESKMTLDFKASDIFPLLCPVVEYDWFPSWGCTMVFSDSGVAELNAIFITKNPDGSPVVWTIITYDPPHKIEFSIVNGIMTVERLSISLSSVSGNKTEILWKVINTGYSKDSIEEVSNLKDEEFKNFIEERRMEMDYYLRTGKMLKK